MADKRLTRLAAPLLSLLATASAYGGVAGLAFLAVAPAEAAARPQKMGGTWDLTWKSRRGNIRTGHMIVEQRGDQLFAEVFDRGGATATGSIRGSAFELRGSRMFIPFTVTGRIRGGRMSGTLIAPGTERHFTGIRRGRR